MKWTEDKRHSTDWEEWFAWHPVSLETLHTGSHSIYQDGKVQKIWCELIERRRVPAKNRSFAFVYREKGSTWDTGTKAVRQLPKIEEIRSYA